MAYWQAEEAKEWEMYRRHGPADTRASSGRAAGAGATSDRCGHRGHDAGGLPWEGGKWDVEEEVCT